ncbi:MAG: transposase domain-containing protein [Burkholderia sp.]
MLGSCPAQGLRDIHASTPSSDTQTLLTMIGERYGIEADIRGKPPDKRLRVRQEKAKPLLAKAIHYSLNHWAALVFSCEDGRTGISNALAENALPCKLNGINPRAYLEYVLTHIADYLITRIDGLLPWNGADKLKPAAIPPSTA